MSDANKVSQKLAAKEALTKLTSIWQEVQSLPYERINDVSFVEDQELREKIQQLVNSPTKAFKYALLTQILAKVVEPSINCLAIQAQAPVSGAFDARSFCRKTIIPFEREQLNNILGASSDPYVGKPLRHEMITLDIIDHIKDKQGWRNLYTILHRVEERKDTEFTLVVLKQILLEIRKLLSQQIISPPFLSSVGTEDIKDILVSYLSKPSQGLRPQAVVYALFKTFNEKTKTFATITTVKATVADVYARRTADIECKDTEDNLKLAICVTEQLNIEKLERELEKAKMNNLGNMLIMSHRIDILPQEAEQIIRKYALDVAISPLVDFIVTMTVILNSEMRKKLVLNMYEVLQELESPDHLREWDRIVRRKLIQH